MIRRVLLVLLFVLAQVGALAHGIGHAAGYEDEGLDHKTVCALCLAFAHVGAGMASTPPAWVPLAADRHFHAIAPAAAFPSFRPLYLSRAPPV